MSQPSEDHVCEPAWRSEDLVAPHAAADKAHRVRRMFDAIAARYELVNSVFSLGRDAAWRRRAVQLAEVRGTDTVLDVACGTGDMARAFADAGAGMVVGTDFSHNMLRGAVGRDSRLRCWCEADAQRLPFRDGSFTIVSCAFGVRNFADLARGLCEMHRVLHPGGRVVILEFTRVSNRALRFLYETYSVRFMPFAASLLAKDRSGAYHYLPRSVESFLTADEMSARLAEAGFSRVRAESRTLGVVTIYLGRRD